MEVDSRLAELLVNNKVLSAAQLKNALDIQKESAGRGKLGTILVRLRYVTEEQLAAFLADQLKLPLLKLKDLVVQPNVSSLADAEFLEKHQILPIRRAGDKLVVAVVDPMDLTGVDELHFMTGLRVEAAVAAEGHVLKAIGYYFHNRPCPELQDAERNAGTASGNHKAVKQGTRASPQAVLQALTELLIEKKVITQEDLLKKMAAKER
ncbi:MAG: hypothetical protein NTW87_14210 [Planctomycetota bacterium]|nr:hypothetical protein [Planctomycetota bacterium]